eukprot:m.420182 g.420182  ORF g.420182 m.420182 type:complete len:372 (-) comp32270_c0_seq1:234-1349(-)
MALVANYSSSGESEEEEAAVAPTVKSCASASKSGEAVVSERLRKRRAPKRSGPSLAEKRRALMGAPVAIPHSDDEDDPGPTAALPPQDPPPMSLTGMLPQPMNSRGTLSGHTLNVSVAPLGANMPIDKFIEAKAETAAGMAASRPLVPHVLGKKKPKDKPSRASAPAPTAAYPPQVTSFSALITIDATPGAPAAKATTTLSASPSSSFGYGKAPIPTASYNAAPQATLSGSYGNAPVPTATGREGSAVLAPEPESQRFETVDVHGEGFQSLLGADHRQRSKHGRDAGIKFVDVDQTDRVGTFDQWQQMHGHSQPAVASGTTHTAKLSTNDKKKHQITWLAAQAKDQQQALEQHWASGAAAKRAARQRYGFH